MCLMLSLSTCGPANGPKQRLEGSLGQVMDLGYDEVTLGFDGTAATVNFRRKKGMGFDTSLSVTTRIDQAALPDGGMEALRGGQTYNLVDVLSSGLPRGDVSRNVLDDPRTTFPPIRVGEMTFNNIPVSGQDLTAGGDFHVTFTAGVEAASGRTVFGSFNAKF